MTHSVQVSEAPSLDQQTSVRWAGSWAVGLGWGKGVAVQRPERGWPVGRP